MDTLSRDLIRAEVDANDNRPDTLTYLASHGPDIERDWSHSALSTLQTSSDGVTPTYTNATQQDLHPLEIDRISRQRTQHQLTVGSRPSVAGRQRSTATVTTLGAGKPLPPRDNSEGYIVEFEGVDDPEHPQNWAFGTKYV